MSTPDLSVIHAEAGTRRPIVLDSRLCGNDKGAGFIPTDECIFVAMTGKRPANGDAPPFFYCCLHLE
jgi:hypothetical protein